MFYFFCDITIEHLNSKRYEFSFDLIPCVRIGMCCHIGVHKGANISDCKNTLLDLKRFNQRLQTVFPFIVVLHLSKSLHDRLDTFIALPTNWSEGFKNQTGVDNMVGTENATHLIESFVWKPKICELLQCVTKDVQYQTL